MYRFVSARRLMLTLIALAAAPGCASEETMPRAEYVERVNQLCASAVETIDAALVPVIESYVAGLGDVSDDGLSDEQVIGLYATVEPVAADLNGVFASMLSEIRGLPVPDSDTATFAAHWNQVESLWAEAYAAIVVASSDPVAARALLAEPDPRLAPTNEAAFGLGISHCVFE